MAVSQTMSTNPSDWLQSYQTQTTTTTTTITTPTAPSRLVPDEGRVSRPIRRRSRASRRTPTTLLNTDPTNFRAMVQHFTGGPSSTQHFPPTTTSPFPASGVNFGFPQHVDRTVAQGSGFQMQYPNNNQVQEQYMYMINNMRGGGDGGGGGSVAPTGPPPGNENPDYDNYML